MMHLLPIHTIPHHKNIPPATNKPNNMYIQEEICFFLLHVYMYSADGMAEEWWDWSIDEEIRFCLHIQTLFIKANLKFFIKEYLTYIADTPSQTRWKPFNFYLGPLTQYHNISSGRCHHRNVTLLCGLAVSSLVNTVCTLCSLQCVYYTQIVYIYTHFAMQPVCIQCIH